MWVRCWHHKEIYTFSASDWFKAALCGISNIPQFAQPNNNEVLMAGSTSNSSPSPPQLLPIVQAIINESPHIVPQEPFHFFNPVRREDPAEFHLNAFDSPPPSPPQVEAEFASVMQVDEEGVIPDLPENYAEVPQENSPSVTFGMFKQNIGLDLFLESNQNIRSPDQKSQHLYCVRSDIFSESSCNQNQSCKAQKPVYILVLTKSWNRTFLLFSWYQTLWMLSRLLPLVQPVLGDHPGEHQGQEKRSQRVVQPRHQSPEEVRRDWSGRQIRGSDRPLGFCFTHRQLTGNLDWSRLLPGQSLLQN